MFENDLNRAIIASQVAEAVANYALADEPLNRDARRTSSRKPGRGSEGWGRWRCSIDRDERDLWNAVFESRAADRLSELLLNPVWIEGAALSEWVARVPGLYWCKGSNSLRRSRDDGVESRTEGWVTYNPPFKSMKVVGGVGTIRLPPAEDGFRIATLTASLNASAGVPALVAPEVWDALHLSEGALVTGTVRWREMPLRWAAQFPFPSSIPRICLALDSLKDIGVIDSGLAPVMVHPFSVMEYWDGSTLLHYFVFAEADTQDRGFRRDLEAFFGHYRKAKGREGSYLLAADVAQPMWDATFASPAEMRREKRSELRLTEARIEDAMTGSNATAALLKRLSELEVDDLKRLSTDAGLDWRRWSQGGRVADEVVRLVDAAIGFGKIPALLYALQSEAQL